MPPPNDTEDDLRAPFLSDPWAASQLSQPNITLHKPFCRVPKDDGEDTLFSETLCNPRSLAAIVAYYPTPSPHATEIPKATTLFAIGGGVNGHPDVLHGGIVATILDESMGILQSENTELLRGPRRQLPDGAGFAGGGMYTAELKIQYLKPVFTPGVLGCAAWFVRREQRKEWIVAEIRQYVEGKERVCARGEAVFVRPKGKIEKGRL